MSEMASPPGASRERRPTRDGAMVTTLTPTLPLTPTLTPTPRAPPDAAAVAVGAGVPALVAARAGLTGRAVAAHNAADRAAAAAQKPKTLELPSVRAAGPSSQRSQRADDLNTIESLSPRGEYPEPNLPTPLLPPARFAREPLVVTPSAGPPAAASEGCGASAAGATGAAGGAAAAHGAAGAATALCAVASL